MKTGNWTFINRAKLGAALGLALGMLGTAHAADRDSLTVTITPNAAYVVDITTGSAGEGFLNLGNVDLGNSTWTVHPATVAVQSTYATTELSLQAQMITGGWTFDANTATDEANALKSWAVFTDTSVPGSPAQASGYFSGTVPGNPASDVFDTTNRGVGTGGGTTLFVALPGDAGYKTMEDIASELVDAPASHSHLWLRFKLPPTTTLLTTKQLQVTLTAGAPVP
jgi:hypothetical protein